MVKTIRLQPRDEKILNHMAQYRMTTYAVLHRLFYPNCRLAAVKSTIRRLRDAGYVDMAKLSRRESYIHFTRFGARVRGYPIHRCGYLGEQCLLDTYGVLGFCCLAETVREKLTEEKLAHLFPELCPFIQKLPCYMDEENGTNRLGCIYVDQGTSTKSLIHKCQQFVEQNRELDAFANYIRQDAFVIGIATHEPSKKEDILLCAKKADLLTPVRPVVVPGLAHLNSQPTWGDR